MGGSSSQPEFQPENEVTDVDVVKAGTYVGKVTLRSAQRARARQTQQYWFTVAGGTLILVAILAVLIIFGNQSSPTTSASLNVFDSISGSLIGSACFDSTFDFMDDSSGDLFGSLSGCCPSSADLQDSLESMACGSLDPDSVDSGSLTDIDSLASDSLVMSFDSFDCASFDSGSLESGSLGGDSCACECADSLASDDSNADSLGIGASCAQCFEDLTESLVISSVDIGNSLIDTGAGILTGVADVAGAVFDEIIAIPIFIIDKIAEIGPIIAQTLEDVFTNAFNAIF